METPSSGFPPPTLEVSANPLDAILFASEYKEGFTSVLSVLSNAALIRTGKCEIKATASSCI